MKGIFLLMLLSLIVSCADKSSTSVVAPSEINQSFGSSTISPDDKTLYGEDKSKIFILEEGLDKEFLLRTQLISQLPAPRFNGIKTRIVAFRKKQDKLYLLESTKGLVLSSEIDATIVLAEFDIKEVVEGKIYFDFNNGMKNLFVSSDWKGSDFGRSNDYSLLETNISYIDSAEITSSNTLYIKQIAQGNTGIGTRTTAVPFEVRYYLSPYKPSKTFKSHVTNNRFKKFGFFQTSPILTENAIEQSFGTKFDPEKPIVFHISSNTPEEYVQAVKDGILYWNQAFGKEIVKVEMAPEGITAPHPQYNIVQWVKNDLRSSAYADAQMDPRTGEILNAQVFFYSGFGLLGKEDYRKSKRTAKSSQIKIGLKGFIKEEFCHKDHSGFSQNKESISIGLNNIDAKSTRNSLRVAQDYIASIMAHEIGHTLGLRHNFAGSVSSEYTLEERDELSEKYFNAKLYEVRKRPSSSVMDYHKSTETLLIGQMIKEKKRSLEYDRLAIQHLYFGTDFTREEVPLFCTDSHVSSYQDCERFDVGRSLVLGQKYEVLNRIKNAPEALINKFIKGIRPSFETIPLSLEEIELYPRGDARKALEKFSVFINSFKRGASLLKIERQYPYTSSLNGEEIHNETLDYLTQESEKLNGLDTFFPFLEADWAQNEYQRFEELLDSEKLAEIIDPNGVVFSFTDEQKQEMKKQAKLYFEKLQKNLVEQMVEHLSGSYAKSFGNHSKLVDTPFINETYSSFLRDKIEEIILSEKDDSLTAELKIKRQNEESAEEEVVVTATLPQFKYPHNLRMKIATSLAAQRSESSDWGIFEKHNLKESVNDRFKEILQGGKLSNLKAAEQPRQIGRWIYEQQSILNALK